MGDDDFKVAIEALRESEHRHRTFADAIQVGFWHGRLSGETIFINRAMCKIFEVDSPEEVIGQKFFSFLPPESIERIAIEHNKRRAGLSSTYEAEIIGRKGRRVPVEVTASPICGPDGQVHASVALIRDISDLKREKEETQRWKKQVEHMEKLKSLGLLAGGIAHDFNNLLVGILGNIGLAKLELPPNSPVLERLEQAQIAARRAADLTHQLLAYSGKAKFRLEQGELTTVVCEMAGLLKTAISIHAELQHKFCGTALPINADLTQLRQVIMNLLTNASDALRGQQGRIVLRTGERILTRADFADAILGQDLTPGSYVYLEVEDSGCGMDALTCKRIFDPFFTTKETGRGLGLAAVLGIVAAHGGTIFLNSVPGQGTKFSVYLPRAAEQVDADGLQVEVVQSTRFAGTVLLVDDEPMVREVASSMLKRLGFGVIEASSGEEALRLFNVFSDEIAAVLLDLTMPGICGIETLQRFRQQDAEVPVMLSSGYSDRIFDVPLDLSTAFLQKPYTIEQLRGAFGKLGKVLSGRAERQVSRPTLEDNFPGLLREIGG